MENAKKQRRRRDDGELSIDPVYHALSRINGSINKMNLSQLQSEIRRVNLNERGIKEVLKKRLKAYYKRQKLCMKPDNKEGRQYYPHLIVVDYEATCEKLPPPEFLHEIIEFPAVLIDTSTFTIVDEFHSYCKPTLNPRLSEFCTSLTGITQKQVDEAHDFAHVLAQFEAWLKKHNLLTARKCAFVTDGSWDFSRFLNIQCCLSEIQYPKWAKKWINLKKIYGNFYQLKSPKMMNMLSNLGLTFEGRHHSGIDDARNLSQIVIRLMQDGAMFQFNERLNSGKLENISEQDRALLNGFPDPAQLEIHDTAGNLEDLTLSSEKP